MRIFNAILPVVCALALSACAGTGPGGGMWGKPGKGYAQTEKPAPGETAFPPTAYSGQNRRGIVLKPPGIGETAPTVTGDLAWNQIDGYDNGFGVPPTDAIGYDLAPIGSSDTVTVNPVAMDGVAVNDAVKVFPLDGDMEGAAPLARPSAFYGVKAEEIFFAHGSSKVKTADKLKLKTLAKKRRRKDAAVTIVGHASKRVDGVTDPMKKKMINFEMAQKRANAVTGELKKAGLDPAWVQAVSKGDDEPNPVPAGKPQEVADRRVEIFMDEQ